MQPASAQPGSASVVAGQAAISAPNAATTLITQSSQKAIINWQSFSVAGGGLVQFAQPNSSAITLNRVTGPSPSAIDGTIRANGQVWLINPNGVLFGQGAQIHVGGLLATTSDIADGDFLSGNYNFSGSSNAAVVNNGTIHARKGGSVVLSGASVANGGLIEARTGHVVLGGADAFTVDFTGDHLLSYAVTQPVARQTIDANGNPQSASVTNSGIIRAAGGKVLMTARAAANIADGVVNNSGMIEATSARVENGEIILDAGGGDTTSSGTLDASGKAAGQTGGSVQALGQTVALADGAKIDVSGDAGGGQALIGGNFHGAGPQANARTTMVGKAIINADAIRTGNGGKVAVWSDNNTQVAGTITARGGAQSGNGGFVETSGHWLGIAPAASVDASALHGAAGSWLLDPANITISDTDPNAPNDQQGTLTSGTLASNADAGKDDYITPATIQNALSGGTPVSLNATNNITVISAVTTQFYAGTTAPSLTFNANGAIAINAAMTMNNYPLFLSSGGAITQSAAISGASLTASSSAGSITLTNTGNALSGTVTFTTPGDIAFNNSVTTNLGVIGNVSGGAASSLTVDPLTNGNAAGITVGGAVNVSGAVSLTAPGNITHVGTMVAGSLTENSSAGSIAIGNTVNVSGDMSLTASGSITQGATIVAGTLTATSTTDSITLMDTHNQISGAVLFNSPAGNTSFTNSINTTVGVPGPDSPQTSVIGGNLDVEVNDNGQGDPGVHSTLTMNGRVHTQQTTVSGDTVLHASGDIINNSGNGTITATNLSLVSDNGSIGAGSWSFGLGRDGSSSSSPLNLHASATSTAPNSGNITINPGDLNIGTDLAGPGIQAGNLIWILANGVITQNNDGTGTIVTPSLDARSLTGAAITLQNPYNAASTLSFTTSSTINFNNSVQTTINAASNGSSTQLAGNIDIEVADPAAQTFPGILDNGYSATNNIASSGTVILHATGAITSTSNPIVANTVKFVSDTAGIGASGNAMQVTASVLTATSSNSDIMISTTPQTATLTIGDGTTGINAGTGNVVLLADSTQLNATSSSAGVITANNLRISTASANLYDVEVSTLNATAHAGAINISTNTGFQLNNVTGAAGAAAIDNPTGSVVLVAKGTAGITQGTGAGGQILAGNFEADASGTNAPVTLQNLNNAITGTINLTSTGNTVLYDSSAAVVGTSTATGDLQIQSAQGLTIASGATLTSNASGTTVILAAGSSFTNNAGSNAIVITGGSRWLVYSANPTGDVFGGLNSNNIAVWNSSFPAGGTGNPGNRYIFSFQPTITVTAGAVSKFYGTAISTGSIAADYTISGLQPGVAGAFLGDTAASIYSGTPAVSASGGTAVGANAGSYGINVAQGSFTVSSSYGFKTQGAILTVIPATLTYNANNASSTAGAAIPTLSGTVTGFVNGDTLTSATTGTLIFFTNATPSSPAGSYYIVGSGLSAANYELDQSFANLTAFTVLAAPPSTPVTTTTVTPPPTIVVPVIVNTITPPTNTAATITLQPLLSFTAAQPLTQLGILVSGLGLTPNNQTAPAIAPTNLVVVTTTPAPASNPIQEMVTSSGNGDGAPEPPSSSDVATNYVVKSLDGGATPSRSSPGNSPIVIPGLLHRVSGRAPGGGGGSVNDSDLSAWGNAALWQ